jgi:organic radical activating enzyme
MLIKNLIDEDFCNYRKPSMFVGFSKCSFKCDKECGRDVCQNSELALAPTIEIDDEEIIQRYITNPITEAIVFGGLEPFDDFNDLFAFIADFRDCSKDDIVIYTGYYPEEIPSYLDLLSANYKNIIIKFGRFIPDKPHRFDELLGIELSSDNQYARRLEDC